jgi:hypothetical protein
LVVGKECDVPVSEFVWGYQVSGSEGQARHLKLARVPFAPLALNLGLHVVMLVSDETEPGLGYVYECHWRAKPWSQHVFTGPSWRHASWGPSILGTRSGVAGYYCYVMAMPPRWEETQLRPEWSRIWQPV